MTDDVDVKPADQPAPQPAAPKPRKGLRRLGLAGAAVALLVLGGAVGGATVARMKPKIVMAPATPVAIAKMADDSIVTIKGSVAEIYGNKFLLQDESGKTLVEIGRGPGCDKLVKTGEQLSVQGRFDDGFVRAVFLVRADGKTETVGGFGPGWGGPRHGPWGHGPKGAMAGPLGDGPGHDRPKEEGRL